MVVSMATRFFVAGLAGIGLFLGGCTEVPDCIRSDDASSGIVFAGQIAQGNFHGDSGGGSTRQGAVYARDKVPAATTGGAGEAPPIRPVAMVRQVTPPLTLPTLARRDDIPVTTPY